MIGTSHVKLYICKFNGFCVKQIKNLQDVAVFPVRHHFSPSTSPDYVIMWP